MNTTVKKNRISKTDNRDNRLLAEVESFCPICGIPLIEEKNGKHIKNFDDAHIYPHSPTKEQREALKGITPPDDIESIDNLIPLCKRCHKSYDSFTSYTDYYNLRRIKDRISVCYDLKCGLVSIGIESEISKVLHELEGIDASEFVELKLDPIPIKAKIPSGTFQTKIIQLATIYYPYLRTQFQQIDSRKTNKFLTIATEFKLVFTKASQENLLLEEIFNQLVSWLKSKTLGSDSACEIVIAFFIHDCEVFNALPK